MCQRASELFLHLSFSALWDFTTHRRTEILCGFVLALFLETYNLNDTNMLREIVVIKSFKGGMTKLYVFSKGHSNCGSLCFGNLVERDIWKS